MNSEYSLILTEEAKQELKSMIARYNVLQEGLGEKVYDEIRQNLTYLKTMPFICPEKYKKIRILYTKKYKMAVYYVIFEEERAVAIYSFLHQKEDPKKVFNRISF